MNLARATSPDLRTRRVSAEGLGIAALHVIYVCAALLALLWTFQIFQLGVRQDVVGFDFEGTLWEPGLAIRSGESPYPEPTLAEVEVGNPAVYPPLLVVVAAPLTFLPWSIAVGLWLALLTAAVAGALFVLDVRDPRCYLFALATPLVAHAQVVGNATLLLVPFIALAWRWRDRWLRAGALVGLAIAAKLFLWPLLFWLLGTRRYRAFGAASVAACAGLLLPWAAIGFDGLSSYADLLRVAEDVYAPHSLSITTVLAGLGLESGRGSAVGLVVGIALAALAFYLGRRRADPASLSVALLAAILASPIVWAFYYAVLLVPLAIARPRFSALWAVLPLFFVAEKLPRDRLSASDLGPGEPPEGVAISVWLFNHADPGMWPALGYAAVGVFLVAATVLMARPGATSASPRYRDRPAE